MFSPALRPVSTNLAALTTITKSPVSICGVNVGLCLPRSSLATSTASLPMGLPSASITCHFRSMSCGLAEYVFMIKLPLICHFDQTESARGCAGPRFGSIFRLRNEFNFIHRPLPATYLYQRTDDIPDH